MDVSPARITEICAAFSRQRILVIGDVMLDHHVHGEAKRISPEAPIPVIHFVDETYTPGGAANVARNLASLGGSVSLFGVIGADTAGAELMLALSAHGLSSAGLIVETGRPTTQKSRITAQRHQVVRLDRETHRPLEATTASRLTAAVLAALPGAAAVIFADYAKGVVTQSLLDAVTAQGRLAQIPVHLDPKPGHPLRMQGCAALTPNRKETFELAGLADPGPHGPPANDEALLQAAARLCEQHGPASLLITLSEAGLLLVEPPAAPCHLPTFARQVFDVTGAGDTVMATFALARAAGASSLEAATLANHAAGIVVGKSGTAAATTAELLASLRSSPGA